MLKTFIRSLLLGFSIAGLATACSQEEEPLYTPLMIGSGIHKLQVNIEDDRGENLFNDANNYKEVSAMGLESRSNLSLEYLLKEGVLVVAPDLPNTSNSTQQLKAGDELPTDFVLTFRGTSIRLTAVFVYHQHPNWTPGMYGGTGLDLERVQTANTIVERKDIERMKITLRYVDGKLQLKP